MIACAPARAARSAAGMATIVVITTRRPDRAPWRRGAWSTRRDSRSQPLAVRSASRGKSRIGAGDGTSGCEIYKTGDVRRQALTSDGIDGTVRVVKNLTARHQRSGRSLPTATRGHATPRASR